MNKILYQQAWLGQVLRFLKYVIKIILGIFKVLSSGERSKVGGRTFNWEKKSPPLYMVSKKVSVFNGKNQLQNDWLEK